MFNPLTKFHRRFKNNKRWRLFHATDFQSLMYPCFTLSRVFGVFPYKINASVFKTSRSGYVLLIIITCITSIYQLIRFYELNILHNDTRNNLAATIQDNCYFMLQSFTLIVSSILCGPRMRLLQTILEVSSKLTPESYKKLSKLIHVKDIFGFLFLTFMSVSQFSQLHKKYLYNVILNYSTYAKEIMELYIRIQIFQLNMLYVNCVCILKACFKRIDDNLKNLRELTTNDKLYVSKLVHDKQHNSFRLEELKALKKEYLIINDTVQMLNITFSPQLLATMTTTFIEITFELYINMVQWQNGLSINLAKQIHHIFIMSYIMYHVIITVLIVWACETGKNQAVKISTIVHDVLNNTSDEKIKNELRLFSLQILHSANKFSAKGFIMDATLLTAMANIITTYLLILIQFLVTSHSCDERTAINITQTIYVKQST